MEDEKNIEELIKQYNKFMKNKDFENALDCLNKLIELNPNDYEAYNNRGLYTQIQEGMKKQRKIILKQ